MIENHNMIISDNRRIFQMKGCDADDIQDNMLIYVPSLTGKPWENIMEACLVSFSFLRNFFFSWNLKMMIIVW